MSGRLAGWRRWLVWLSNAALLAAFLWGFSLIASGSLEPDSNFSLRGIYLPLQLLGLGGALRLATSRRDSGLERLVVNFFARRGLPPRDANSTLRSAWGGGGLLGVGLGGSIGTADAVRVIATASRPALPSLQAVELLAAAVATGAVLGLALGSLIGVTWWRVAGLRRYELGKRTLASLCALAPLIALSAPSLGGEQHAPRVLLSVALSLILALLLGMLVIPAAILRARQHQWGLAAVSACIAISIILVSLLAVAGGPRDRPHLSGSGPSNLLLIEVEGLRADFIGAYGSRAGLTAQIDALADRGALFREVWTPSDQHREAALGLITGRYPHPDRELSDRGLGEILGAHGFASAAFVGCACIDRFGLDLAAAFDTFDDQTGTAGWMARAALLGPFIRHGAAPPRNRNGKETVQAFRDWLTQAGSGPWMAWVDIADPARPWPRRTIDDPPLLDALSERHDEASVPAPSWIEDRSEPASAADWLRGYAFAVRSADEAIGDLLDLLVARGELHRTVVIVVASHGVTLGEDGSWFEPNHGIVEPVLRVPWVLSGPGIAPGRKVPGAASLVDVVPTALGLLGLSGGEQSEGEDLSSYLSESRAAERDPHSGPVFAEARWADGGTATAAKIGPYKLVRSPAGEETLYLAQGGVETELPSDLPTDTIRRELSDLVARQSPRPNR